MYVSSIGIQKTQIDKGAMADKGIHPNRARSVKATLKDEERSAIGSYLARVMEPVIDKIAGGAKVDKVTDCSQLDDESKREAIKAGIMRNISEFDPCSGSGFTAVLLEGLKADPEFEGCFPVGSDAPASAPDTTTVLDLSDLVE